jgi:hypothetical protein
MVGKEGAELREVPAVSLDCPGRDAPFVGKRRKPCRGHACRIVI